MTFFFGGFYLLSVWLPITWREIGESWNLICGLLGLFLFVNGNHNLAKSNGVQLCEVDLFFRFFGLVG